MREAHIIFGTTHIISGDPGNDMLPYGNAAYSRRSVCVICHLLFGERHYAPLKRRSIRATAAGTSSTRFTVSSAGDRWKSHWPVLSIQIV